jgi:hypothetical protein
MARMARSRRAPTGACRRSPEHRPAAAHHTRRDAGIPHTHEERTMFAAPQPDAGISAARPRDRQPSAPRWPASQGRRAADGRPGFGQRHHELRIDDLGTAVHQGWPAASAGRVLALPRGTPRPIVDRFAKGAVGVLRQPDTIERFTARGMEIIASSPEDPQGDRLGDRALGQGHQGRRHQGAVTREDMQCPVIDTMQATDPHGARRAPPAASWRPQ